MNPYIKFKHKKDIELFNYLNPVLLDVIDDMASWAETNKVPFLITATISDKNEDIKLNRVSDSHSTRRAVDVRSIGWSSTDIELFVKEFNKKYGSIGAISKTNGKSNLVVYHNNGNGDHFHISLNKSYSMPPVNV